jgi:predicted transcriptional regulator of viral defense system
MGGKLKMGAKSDRRLTMCHEVYILHGMATRLSIAKPDIVKALDELPMRVLRQKDIGELLERNRAFWRLAQSTSLRGFIAYLLDSTKLQRVHLPLPHREETLFVWGEVSPFVLASSAKPNAYLCHYTAMHLHELTDQVPETIYANFEQRPVPTPLSPPTQASIDSAFRRPQRLTTNICPLWNYRLCMVNGKHTGRLGVEEKKDDRGLSFSVTGLERTLIDITVRPAYAGGVSEVLEAFRRAAGRVSLNKLSAMLKKMAFVYPYEQSIGFYLEHSGAFEQARVDLFRSERFEHDFYLTYAMKKTEYSPRWRIHYPAGL